MCILVLALFVILLSLLHYISDGYRESEILFSKVSENNVASNAVTRYNLKLLSMRANSDPYVVI